MDAAQGAGPKSWVSLPRYHHQYLPDVIQHEPMTFSEELAAKLIKKGHILKSVGRRYGNMHAILWNKKTNKVLAASDLRGGGSALVKRVD
ncbi:MAG: hypothetical protein COB89_04850 [Piscirickettsiaceae bacterium]|nr:MAG: hypothetical protein COB89_04850 [Piscirickettsiaceae bacterium]